MKKSTQLALAFGFGVAFLLLMLALAVFVPYPTAFQYLVFRVTLALAAGGFAAMLPGFLDVTLSFGVKAGGALAAFVVVYFLNPAALTVQGRPTDTPGVFVKELASDKDLALYYWKQADAEFRFPVEGWRLSTKSAEAGLGDLTLEHQSGKDAQIQIHVSLLDDKYRDRWPVFRENTESLWEGTISQFGPFQTKEVFIDGRSSFRIDGVVKGQVQGLKNVTLVYAPLGDNRLLEIHLTRNAESPVEQVLSRALDLVLSTIHFDRQSGS